MNRYQIATLIIGGVLFIAVVFTTPLIQYGPYGVIWKATTSNGRYANRVDIGSASIRGVAVLIGIGLVWYALGFIKKR